MFSPWTERSSEDSLIELISGRKLERQPDDPLSIFRQNELFNEHVRGLVHPINFNRKAASEKAVSEIKNPKERAHVVGEVRRISESKEQLRRQRNKGTGFFEKYMERTREAVLSPIQSLSDVKESFYGPNRPLGVLFGKGRLSKDDISFKQELESAKISENPFVAKEAGTLARGISGAAGLIPDAALGAFSYLTGGPTGVAAYTSFRTQPGAIEQHQQSGLSGPAAALAGTAEAVGTGILETLIPDPTGILRKAKGPLARAGSAAIVRFAKKAFPKAIESGGKALAGKLKTKAALREFAGYLYRAVGENIEEGSQGAWAATVDKAAALLSENVESQGKWSVPKAFIRDVKESALPIAILGTAGPIKRAIEGGPIEERLRKHLKNGTVPSRREWKEVSTQKATAEQKQKDLPDLVEEFNIQEIIEARGSDAEITKEQRDRWDLPPEAGTTPAEWTEYINQQVRETDDLEAPEAPVATREAPGQPPVDVQQAEVSEIALEQQAATEAPAAIPPTAEKVDVNAPNGEITQEQADQAAEELYSKVNEDRAADLNKAAGGEIRSDTGLPPIEDPKVRSFKQVLSEVFKDNLQRNSVRKAGSIIDLVMEGKKPTMNSDTDHAAMMVRTQELLTELDENRNDQNVASEENATEKYRMARAAEKEIVKDLDIITAASQFSGTEVARALNIMRLRSSREDFSAAGVLSAFRKSKGSDPSEEQLENIADLTREFSEDEKQVLQQEMQDFEAKENRQREAAERILNKNMGKGERIKENAKVEIEDIKKRLRQLGLKIHDVTPLTAEGLYLVGRLGIAYAKSGVGSIVEVVENLKRDLSDLELTDQEIYQALITKDPKLVVRARKQSEKNVRNIKTAARLLLNIERMANGIAPEVTGRAPTTREIKNLQKEFTKAKWAFFKTDIEAAKIEKAFAKIDHIQNLLETGELKIKESKEKIPPELQNLQEKIRQLNSELNIDAEIARIDKKIESNDFSEDIAKRVEKPISEELREKQIKLAEKKQEIRELIENAKPWDLKRRGKSVAAEMKAVAATADMSFAFRQNLWQMFAHPIRNITPFKRSFVAFFSTKASNEIANDLRNSSNAELYQLSGLNIMDAGSAEVQHRSEVFRGRAVENFKMFGKQNPFGVLMTASSRHSIAIGNLVRASAFDAFMDINPNATMLEMRAMADYINKSTGLGYIGAGKAAEVLQEIMFSPKFAASRFQTPWALVKNWKKSPRVRKAIAQDMVRMGSTGFLILMLAKAAGADVELWDLNSPDWAKIRVGDTRYDIYGGFLQAARLTMRLSAGPFSGGKDFDNFDALKMVGRYIVYKAAPAISTPLEFAMNKTVVGEETTKLETFGRAFRPLIVGDILDAWRADGPLGVLAVGPFAFFGGGASTYTDSWSAAKRRRDNFRSRGQHTKAAMVVREFNKTVKKGGRTLASR